MNVIAAINTIFTNTRWIVRYEEQEDEIWTNYGFSIEKIIILKEATVDKRDHYNNANSSLDADKILEVLTILYGLIRVICFNSDCV